MAETNASPLTAVLHFHRGRHKIEDQKSNKSLKDEFWAPAGWNRQARGPDEGRWLLRL